MPQVRWACLLAVACTATLAVGQPARAASGDSGARRVVQAQAAEVWAQFGRAESCFAQRSASCVTGATFRLYADAVQARATVAALLLRPISAKVRIGIRRYVAALELQVRLSFQLYQAGLSLYVARIDQALINMRSTFRDADSAVARVISATPTH